MNLKSVTGRAVIITLVAAAVVLAYDAQPGGYTFALGSSFNLRIDSTASYNGVPQPASTWALKNLVAGSDKFFNLTDVKPGDSGEATISIHVNKDAWICLDFENLKQAENGRNEPELLADNSGATTSGELAAGTEFFAWYDDGDNIFEIGEKPIFGTSTQAATFTLNNKTYALADAVAGAAYPANQTAYIGLTWCAGNLSVATSSASVTCDGSALGNVAQTDSFSVDIGFRAVPKIGNPKFACKKTNTQCEWPQCNGNCGNTVIINVTNSGSIVSNIGSSSNTGGNTVIGGGTITTGNATSSVGAINILNTILIQLGL